MPSWNFPFVFFISYAYICTCIRRHLKETIPSCSITWSEMGKQNIQAKEVYCHFMSLRQRGRINYVKFWQARETMCMHERPQISCTVSLPNVQMSGYLLRKLWGAVRENPNTKLCKFGIRVVKIRHPSCKNPTSELQKSGIRHATSDIVGCWMYAFMLYIMLLFPY